MMCVMIIWPTEQFSVSSCTMMSRPVLRTEASIVALSHGTIERRSMRSTPTSPFNSAMASSDFSMVLPQATSVRSSPSRQRRATPSGMETTGVVTSRSAQSMCLGTRKSTRSSACIAVQSRPAASSGVLGMTMLMPGKCAKTDSLACECQSPPPGR